jgi:DNA polymerase bacteriophage-type
MTMLSIDFETASTVDLRRTGVARYAHHPTTRVLCMAYAFDNDPVELWRPDQPFPAAVAEHVRNHGRVRGWNIKFEYYIWTFVLRRPYHHLSLPLLSPGTLDDTMAQAAYWGLPLSLDMASRAIGASTQKDADGHALMLRMCRPRSITPGTNAPVWWHETDQAKYDRLCEYCKTDVEAEREIASRLNPLPPHEQSIWRMDFRINRRGVAVDLELVDKLKSLAKQSMAALSLELAALTNMQVPRPTATAALLNWLRTECNLAIPDLRRETVKEWLKQVPAGTSAHRALAIRYEAARTSTAKLTVLQEATHEGYLCGMLQHYGAPRTGRWAGRLFQPQNLPRGSVKNIDLSIDAIKAGATIDDVELLANDSPLAVVASALRGCLTTSGSLYSLVSADLSQIEARVVAWLAGQNDILRVFADPNRDPYVYAANRIGSKDRQLGKVMTLALGFGMGPGKFIDTAKVYGITLDPKDAEHIVRAWRHANMMIVGLWNDADRAVRDVLAGAKPISLAGGKITVAHPPGGHLYVRLPSGRMLTYREPSIEFDPDMNRDGITFMGVNQYTRQWSRCRTYGGKLVENWTQAVARDVMADNLLAIEERGFRPVLSVHDEVVCETPTRTARLVLDRMLNDIMRRPPAWAPDLPVDASGWIGPRYKK